MVSKHASILLPFFTFVFIIQFSTAKNEPAVPSSFWCPPGFLFSGWFDWKRILISPLSVACWTWLDQFFFRVFTDSFLILALCVWFEIARRVFVYFYAVNKNRTGDGNTHTFIPCYIHNTLLCPSRYFGNRDNNYLFKKQQQK